MHIDIQILIKQHNEILTILNQNNTNNSRLVGGCVRDFLQNQKISEDVDISTIFTPDEVIEESVNESLEIVEEEPKRRGRKRKDA